MEKEFEDIRPYNNDEVKQAMNALLADRQFDRVLQGFLPWMPKWVRHGLFRLSFIGVHTILDFQLRFMRPVVNYVLRKCSKGAEFDCKNIDPNGRYTFMSNHRDIVLDSAILDVLLYEHGFPTTCEIAIGDNLLIYPWIRTLVRLNKAFTVRRGISSRELLQSSMTMSRYMHYAINEKRENIWIAQREGRAKDSSDHTQESVLKMMAMGGEGSPIQRLSQLNIVPLTISYEYDPCDWLKAEELQRKRDDATYRKTRQEDLENMKTGILGYKGRIRYKCGSCLNGSLPDFKDLPRAELFKELASSIDNVIHGNYHLFPGNYVALDELNGDNACRQHYSEKEKETFDRYVEGQLKKIRLVQPDWEFLRRTMLTMYANPVVNRNRVMNG